MNRILVSLTMAALLCATANAQQAFKTPDEAASALAGAAKAGDPKAIVTVLGPDGADIASSGDPGPMPQRARNSSPPTMRSTRSRWKATTRRSLSSARRTFPSPSRFSARMARGVSTPKRAGEILFRRIGKNELETRSSHHWRMSTRRTTTPTRTAPAPAKVSTRSVSSAAPARRTGCIGQTLRT